MKKILITGANSYIGTSFEKYMEQYNNYQIDTLDMMNPEWRNYDFSTYNVVFHVAGIAHQKETKQNAHLYYEINRDLAVEVAKKSKAANVKQFIFMSSMSVYGLDYSNEPINVNTPTIPKTNYGKSKLEAEQEILKLNDKDFIISIIRPPMVYGENCPGNLTRLFNVVRKVHIFPTVRNERSVIYIDCLCENIKKIIDRCKSEIYMPQNDRYMCTYEIVKKQMKEENIGVIYLSAFNLLIKGLIGRMSVITKIFGDLKYEK